MAIRRRHPKLRASRLRALLIALLILPAVVTAQTVPCAQPPGEPPATYVETVNCLIPLESPEPLVARAMLTDLTGDPSAIITTVCVWRRPDGGFDYVIDVERLLFEGSLLELDQTTAVDLFDRISPRVIVAAIDRGLYAGQTGTAYSTVYVAACVARTGSGAATRFELCGEELAWREFAFDVAPGAELVRLRCSTEPLCPSPCEPTTFGVQPIIE
jgi:hypothetical protein